MGSQERRDREKEQRRELFIEVARRLMLERGYEATSIDDIAKAAEFSKRTVYLYFADKRELFLAVVATSLEQMHEELKREIVPGDDPLTALLALGSAYFDFTQDHDEDFRLISEYESREYSYRRPRGECGPFESRCLEINDANTELLLDLIHRGQQAGEIRSDASPIELMLLAWGHMMGIAQVVSMRRQRLEEPVYGTSPAALFALALSTLRRAFTDEISANS